MRPFSFEMENRVIHKMRVILHSVYPSKVSGIGKMFNCFLTLAEKNSHDLCIACFGLVLMSSVNILGIRPWQSGI